MPSNTITGVGSALVDVLINETDEFLQKISKEKVSMTYVTADEQQAIIAASSQRPVIVPGGAACNTILGVGNLGGAARFIGARGKDEYGDIFENAVRESRVEPILSYFDTPTGKVVSIVTPDGQRSMFTDLGASGLLEPAGVTGQLFSDTAIALVEGYLLFNRDLMMASVKAAKTAGALIALDLASFEVVNASKDILQDLIAEYVDILIANEDEAKAYTGESDESAAIEKLSVNVEYAVLKVGSRGSYISHDNTVTRIEPVKGNAPLDTTGAGDLWAAGFLYGIANGLSIEKSGALGSLCGYEVCQVMGAQIPNTVWEKIKATI